MSSVRESIYQHSPTCWEMKPIGEVFNVVERPVKMDNDKPYRRVTVKRRHGGIELRDIQLGANIKVKNQYLIKAGDFLISERQIVHGACGIVPAKLEGALVSNEYLVLEPNKGFDTRYFNYLVQLLKYAKLFLLCSQGVDIEKFLFKPKDWLKKEIPAPPLSEQKKIAVILTAMDDKLDVIARQITATNTLKQGLMQTLFSRGMGTQDADGRWVPHTKFKDSDLGEMPAKWAIVQIQEISDVIRGASPRPQGDPRYYGGDVPRLMGADVTRDGKWVTPKIDFLTEAGAKLSRPCPKGTLTIICSGDVGIPAFLAVDACIHDGFLALINIQEDKVNNDYLYHIISSLKQRFDSSATHGGVFTNLTTGILKEFSLPLPPIVEQDSIATVLNAADGKITALKRKHTYYQTLKRGLMQKLLTGEWRVKLNDVALAD